jgi:hypothetical protein
MTSTAESTKLGRLLRACVAQRRIFVSSITSEPNRNLESCSIPLPASFGRVRDQLNLQVLVNAVTGHMESRPEGLVRLRDLSGVGNKRSVLVANKLEIKMNRTFTLDSKSFHTFNDLNFFGRLRVSFCSFPLG